MKLLMKRLSGWLAAGVALWLFAVAARGNMVTIGSPGNTGELSGASAGGYGPDAICGAVAYTYQISAFEVTAGEWCAFLNAVDPTGGNALGLYDASMDSNGYGCQITRHAGSTYDFSGRPSGEESDWTNRPVNYVSWYDAARYCNWLTTGDTERGVYDTSTWASLDHTTAASTLGVTTVYFIPTEDEWYKAAYYDPSLNGGAGGYYDYPTGSNTAPGYVNNSGNLSGTGNPFTEGGADPGTYATYDGDGPPYGIGPPYSRTNVGEWENSASPFMTYDQGGNVWEWNETLISSSYRGLRGGAFIGHDYYLRADVRVDDSVPAYELENVGFRVASISIVPEPGSLGLLALAGLVGLKRRRRLGR